MKLTFEQAARGCNKEIRVNIVDTCPRCRGSRSEPGYGSFKCSYCDGTGMETISTGTFALVFIFCDMYYYSSNIRYFFRAFCDAGYL